MKILIHFLLIISISFSLNFRKFLNLKNKVFFGRFVEFSNVQDDLGYPIPFFGNYGELTEEGILYYEMSSRIISGEKVGTVITAETTVGINNKYGLGRINDDIYISEQKYLVDLVHKNDADIILKIVNFLDDKDESKLNETEIINKYREKISNILSKEDITKLENDFVQGVLRAKLAGYDGAIISLNGNCGNNLLNYFLSSKINKRKDEYGGNDINNRVKIIYKIIEKIRYELGYEFPLGFKISYPDGYLNIKEDDVITACKYAEKFGIDFINIDTSEDNESINYDDLNEKKEKEKIKRKIIIEFLKKLSDNIKKTQIVIFQRGILDYKDLKILAELGIKFWFSINNISEDI